MGRGRKRVRNVSPKKEEEEEEGEDRISSLPDDLIHHILSNMDAKDVIRTCLLSSRWRHIWRSLPHLNFDGCHFSNLHKFTKFVSQFLSNRSHQSHISVLNFNSDCREIDHSFIRKIALYTHNAQKLNITSYVSLKEDRQLPLSVFNSSSLKEFCLYTNNGLIVTNIDGYSWKLGALTTLDFNRVSIVSCHKDGSGKSIDHFSNLLNLRHLTLTACQILNSNALIIISPRLETLTISCWREQDVFVVSTPNLSSFNYLGHSHSIYSDGFPCIERVIIHVWDGGSKQKVIQGIIGLFYKFCNAMSLTLAMDTVYRLSSIPELLENQTSPFCNLRWLKIVKNKYFLCKSTISRHAITYLCNGSPDSTIINECEEYFHDP